MKRTVALLLILCALLSFVACGSSSTPADNNQAQQASTDNQPQHTHSFGDWTTTKAPTCTETGEQERFCSCGEKQTQTVNALGHDWVDASCTYPKKCWNCGITEGSALGHNYQNGKCTRCFKIDYPTFILPDAGGSYNYYNDATFQITKIEEPDLKYKYETIPNELWYVFKIAIKSIYDKNGNNYSRTATVGYKIYDEDLF